MLKFFGHFLYDCRTVVIPLLSIIVATVILFCMGYGNAAWFVSSIGTFLVMLANVVYVTAFHSRKRWPDTTWWTRTVRFFTFQ